MYYVFFFFFSSRRRHTRLQGDWSSDVCSSDLRDGGLGHAPQAAEEELIVLLNAFQGALAALELAYVRARAEGPALAIHHDDLDGLVAVSLLDRVRQRPAQRAVHGVHGLWPVEPDPGHAVLDGVPDYFRYRLCLGHRQRPANWALRFSRNARMPSF